MIFEEWGRSAFRASEFCRTTWDELEMSEGDSRHSACGVPAWLPPVPPLGAEGPTAAGARPVGLVDVEEAEGVVGCVWGDGEEVAGAMRRGGLERVAFGPVGGEPGWRFGGGLAKARL
jgi:hypothetical protein